MMTINQSADLHSHVVNGHDEENNSQQYFLKIIKPWKIILKKSGLLSTRSLRTKP
jgi:hypothetical protein